MAKTGIKCTIYLETVITFNINEMTETELLHYLETLNFEQEFNKFVALAQQRLQFYSKYDECDLGGITAKDIVQEIFVKIVDKPETIPKGIDLKGFRKKFLGMINNEAKHQIIRKKTIHASSYDPTEQLEDEQFLDFVFSENELLDKSAQERLRDSVILDKIADLLLSDERAWIVLSDLRDGKTPQEISQDNGIDIKHVRLDVKKIDRLIKSKASVPV